MLLSLTHWAFKVFLSLSGASKDFSFWWPEGGSKIFMLDLRHGTLSDFRIFSFNLNAFIHVSDVSIRADSTKVSLLCLLGSNLENAEATTLKCSHIKHAR